MMGTDRSAPSGRWEIRVTNRTENLSVVRSFLAKVLGRLGLRRDERNKVVLAVDEAVANVVEHGYPPGETGEISVGIDHGEDRIKVVIRDRGIHFDPRNVAAPDMKAHVQAGKKGGLGIFLIKKIMDEVHYGYGKSKENRLVLVKRLDGAEPGRDGGESAVR